MSGVFLRIVNMSISASWIVIAVLLLRLLLKKAPKWMAVLLWGIVAVRLICPFSVESILSLIPSSETISKEPDAPTPHFESGFAVIDDPVNEYLSEHYFEAITTPPENFENMATPPAQFEGVARPAGYFADVTTVLAIVWIVGMAILLTYAVISYLRVKRKIGTAVRLRDNIFQSENVVSPFVLGIIKPKVYLPFNIGGQDIDYVIAHEYAHIRRKDHWWKPFGFLVLALHWFNPLMWLGYALLCRDIELACDEKVVKELDAAQKADYSQALLTCSVNRRVIAACPLAFGEVGVKNRVKSVLNYKKPAFWLIIVAILAGVVAAVCFLTDPVSSNETDETEELLAVLNNEKAFINESGETVFFKDHKPFDSIDVIPEKYALLDLDGDSTEELIVHITPDIGAYTVFNVYDDKVYGFDFGERAIIDLKTDGSFMQSSGAGENSFATLRFEKDHYVIVEQAYINDLANVYRINDAPATAEEANAFADTFYKKDDVQWEKCKEDDSSDDQNKEIFEIQLIDEAQVGDYPTDAQYHDTKAPSQDWKIVVKATKDVTDFRFVELDESEALTVGDTLFVQGTFKADSPVLLHTYINDATLNRGISYRDENGTVRYFGFELSGRDGSISLKEIQVEKSDDYDWDITTLPKPTAVDRFDVTVLIPDADVDIAGHTIIYNGKERGKGDYSYLGEWDGRYYFWGIENYYEDVFICSCDKEYKDFQKHPDIDGSCLHNGVFYGWKRNGIKRGLYAYDLRTKQESLLLDWSDGPSGLYGIDYVFEEWVIGYCHYLNTVTQIQYNIKTGEATKREKYVSAETGKNGVIYGFRFENGQVVEPFSLAAYDVKSEEMMPLTVAQNVQELLDDNNGDVWAKELRDDGTTVLIKIIDGNNECNMLYADDIVSGWYYYRYRPEGGDKDYLARLNLKTGETEYCPNIDLTGLRFEVQPHYWGRD